MTTWQFTSNIKCKDCVKKVTPIFESYPGISRWGVDTDNSARIVTVVSFNLDWKQLKQDLNNAGYNIELLSKWN